MSATQTEGLPFLQGIAPTNCPARDERGGEVTFVVGAVSGRPRSWCIEERFTDDRWSSLRCGVVEKCFVGEVHEPPESVGVGGYVCWIEGDS